MAVETENIHNFLIIVHAGAGYHSKMKEALYNEVCYNACLESAQLFKEKSTTTAMDVAVKAVEILEKSPVTNAGYGSNLTLDSTVECDASVMCSKTGLFGSVGALSGIVNPVKVAYHLYYQQLLYPTLSLGRIPPMTLVGSGAYQWAVSQGIPHCSPNSLISVESFKYHTRYMTEINNVKAKSKNAKRPRLVKYDKCSPLDTVGSVCIDTHGNIAVAASSGGIACKQSGRLGQASLYGYGCWAERKGGSCIGLVCTGTGEQLVRTRFAMKCAQTLIDGNDIFQDAYNSFTSDFLSSPLLNNLHPKSAGIVALKKSVNDYSLVDALYAHTTESMSIAHFSSQMKQPKSFISRRHATATNSDSVVIGGFAFRYQSE